MTFFRRGATTLAALLLAISGVATAAASPGLPVRLTLPALSALLAESSTPGLWEPPLGHPLEIDAVFSLPFGPYGAGHRGVDLLAGGDPRVRAPASGTVAFVGMVVDRPVISIRVDDRTVLSMEPVESALQAGDMVSRGAIVGEVLEGHCAELCVHLGVRVDGAYVNPLRFLRPRPVLLPW